MKLSEHFDSDEFTCHSGELTPASIIPNIQELVTGVLEPVRQYWGAPLVVISGWRSKFWNDRIGGAATSTHMSGQAADVRPISPADVQRFSAIIEEMRDKGMLQALGGVGRYPGWIHLDTRHASDGHLRRWMGTGMGSERLISDAAIVTGLRAVAAIVGALVYVANHDRPLGEIGRICFAAGAFSLLWALT